MTKKDLSRFCTRVGSTLLQAIKCLDQAGVGALFIVDENNRMLGLLTDGDIRKSLLRGMGLDAPLASVMNPDFQSGRTNQTRESLLKFLLKIKRRHLPILDDNGALVDVILLDEVDFRRNETRVVLMAGGLGSRLMPLTEDRPKPMLEVGGKPILELIIDSFIQHGFDRFTLSINYRGEVIEKYFGDGSKWNISIDYIREPQRLGTAGALALLPERPKQPFIVMNADLVTTANFRQLLDFHCEHGAAATMAVRRYEVQVPYGVVQHNGHHITKIVEKPTHEFYVNAGIYVLDPSCLDLIPKDSICDMPMLFESLLAKALAVTSFPIHEQWLDVGQLRDLEHARSLSEG